MQDDVKEVLNIIRERIKNDPTNSKMVCTYGILLIEVGHYDAAVEILREGLTYKQDDAELWSYLGLAYWRKDDQKNAITSYQKAILLNKHYPVVFFNLASLYLSRYVESKNEVYFKNSVKNFKKAIELDPCYASAYNGLGTAYVKANNIEAAINCWEKTIKIKPEFSSAVYNLALAYLAKGNSTKALKFFNKYKKNHYEHLTQGEKDQFDALIKKCQNNRKRGDTAYG